MTYELKDVLVQVEGVSLTFDEFQVLKSTSVQIQDLVSPDRTKGQIIGVLGPSGVGKTQFSRILTGLQKPSTGQVSVNLNGKLTPVTPGVVGMVAQNYPLFRHRTVLGNLLVALEHSSLSNKERREKALSMLREFQLEAKANAYPSQLSGGQRQRVAIIRELLCCEHYLVLDEPFTGLDPLMKIRTCDLIVQVSNLHESNTVIVVAHDIAALVRISDYLWLFGRDRDEAGQPIPGATIKHTYDLTEVTEWRQGEFHSFCDEVEGRFQNL